VDGFREWPVELLAEGLETGEEFEECRDAGVDLFQGFFLSRPEAIVGNVSNRQAGLLNLLTKLQSSCQTFDQLEQVVIKDADLCYRMMRYLDSSSVGLQKEIGSVRHGLVLLGVAGVRRVLTLLALQSVEGKPSERLASSLIRACMCETICQSMNPGLTDAAYTTGLFSQLDAILNQPMREVMKSVPLTEDVRDAILTQEGLLGQILQTTIAYETADWTNIDLGLCAAELMKSAYLDAVKAADSMMREIATAHV
jgi:EAL and modified HD-GYP domain-containing signal transduction protein